MLAGLLPPQRPLVFTPAKSMARSEPDVGPPPPRHLPTCPAADLLDDRVRWKEADWVTGLGHRVPTHLDSE